MAKKWYVINTYSGYEDKVKNNLLRRIESMKGQTLSNPLVFESAGEMIADVGEFVNNELLSRIQHAFAELLATVEAALVEDSGESATEYYKDNRFDGRDAGVHIHWFIEFTRR